MRRAFRGYTLLVAGNIVSTFGSSIYLVTLLLYLARVTDSPLALGLVQFLAYLPAALAGPFAGALVDRWNRKRVVVWTDVARGAVMAGIGVWALAGGRLHLWSLYLATAVIGASNVLFVPAVQVLIPELIQAGKLKAANAVRSATTQIANLAGSAVGGVLFAILGAPLVLLLNGASFLVSAGSEAFIRPTRSSPAEHLSMLASIRAGFRFLRDDSRIRSVAIIQVGMNLLLPPLIVALPFVIRDVWGLPDVFFGYMTATVLFGGVSGYIISVLRPPGARTERTHYLVGLVLVATALVVLAPLVAMGRSAAVLLAVFPAFCAAGAGVGIVYLTGTTWIQSNVPANLRGRVFAAIETATAAVLPLAYAASGFVVEAARNRLWYVFAGVAVCAGSLAILARVKVGR